MTLKSLLLTGSLAAAMLAASAAVALAGAPSMAQDATLYSAPGGDEIDTIDGGDDVSIGSCQGGYCYVKDLDDTETEGWVKSATIDRVGDDDDDADASPVNENGSLVSGNYNGDGNDDGDAGQGHHHRRH